MRQIVTHRLPGRRDLSAVAVAVLMLLPYGQWGDLCLCGDACSHCRMAERSLPSPPEGGAASCCRMKLLAAEDRPACCAKAAEIQRPSPASERPEITQSGCCCGPARIGIAATRPATAPPPSQAIWRRAAAQSGVLDVGVVSFDGRWLAQARAGPSLSLLCQWRN